MFQAPIENASAFNKAAAPTHSILIRGCSGLHIAAEP